MANIYCRYDDYYGNNPARELAHRVKESDVAAIRLVAEDLAPSVREDCALIPVPNSIGFPLSNLLLVKLLVAFIRDMKVNADVWDIMVCRQHRASYYCKKEGKQMDEADFGFRLTSTTPEGKKIYLVDNVLATGLTASAALKVVPSADILVHTVDRKTFEASAYRSRFSEIISSAGKEQLKQHQKQKNRLKL